MHSNVSSSAHSQKFTIQTAFYATFLLNSSFTHLVSFMPIWLQETSPEHLFDTFIAFLFLNTLYSLLCNSMRAINNTLDMSTKKESLNFFFKP